MGLKRFLKRAIIVCVCLGIVLLLVYAVALRPWSLRMGANDSEVVMQLPGDNLVSDAGFQYTQAITIDAPKDIVWAYLIQIGYKRGGWYNIDWINGMIKDYFYEGGKSAGRIIPELQDLKEGDKIFLNPSIPGFLVSKLEKHDYMILTAADTGTNMETVTSANVSWVFKLQEMDSDTTRFIVRWRSVPNKGFSGFIMDRFMDVGSAGLQQPAMLRGLKSRAEAEYDKK